MRRSVLSLSRSAVPTAVMRSPSLIGPRTALIAATQVHTVTPTRFFSARNQRLEKDKRPPFYVPVAGAAAALRGRNKNIDKATTDSALEAQLAYRHYAEQLDLCDDEALQQGIRQAHDSLAMVIDRLTASESEPSKEMVKSYQKLLASGMKKQEISAVLKTWHAETTLAEGRAILSESFRPESEWDLSRLRKDAPAAPTASASASDAHGTAPQTESTVAAQATNLAKSLRSTSSKQEKERTVRRAFDAVKSDADLFVAGLMSIVPISPAMAEDLLMLWAGYRLGLSNVLCLAGPNDLVESTQVAGLIDLYNGKVYGEDTLRREYGLEVRLTDALKEQVASHPSTESAPASGKVYFKSEKRATPSHATAAEPALNASDSTTAPPSSASSASSEAAVRFLLFGLHDIPLDARLALFVSVKVHVPKERYPRFFAPHTVRERLGDAINRAGYVILGCRFPLLDTEMARSLLGYVPTRVDGYTVGHGLVEKLMIMYLEPSGRWVMSDLVPVRSASNPQAEAKAEAEAQAKADAENPDSPEMRVKKRNFAFAVALILAFSFVPTLIVLLWCYATYKAILYVFHLLFP